MSQQLPQDHISKRTVLFHLADRDAVTSRLDVVYGTNNSEQLTMDLYYPPRAEVETHPAVIIAAGFPDAGYRRVMGCRFKEMGSSVSWAKLIAASGMVAIVYTNTEPAADLASLIRHLKQNGESLGIDGDLIGIWANSGNAPVALSTLMLDGAESTRCAVICYGYMLDLDGSSVVAEASRQWGFANPCAGKRLDDLRDNAPLLVVRAGLDQFGNLNQTIDWFAGKALNRNLPITLINYPEAPHAFDLFLESAATREIIKQILAFLRFHLAGSRVETEVDRGDAKVSIGP